MNEPQVWTLIAVFTTAMFGTLSFGFASLRSEMRNSINGLRGELSGDINGLRTEVRAGFESVNKRIDCLERDVQYLMRKEFGDSPNHEV